MGWEQLLAFVSGKVDQQLQLKVEYLVAENRILRRQISGKPKSTDGQRITLSTIGKKLGRAALDAVASTVTPDTLLRWHRELVAKKFDTSDRPKTKPVGRPPTDPAVIELVLRLARENPTCGYRRITGMLTTLDHDLSHQTVANILEEHGVDPAPKREVKTTWADFIRSHTDCLLATDFFTTEVWTACGLVTYYCLFFIHVASRKVYIGGITRNLIDEWMRQAARNLASGGCQLLSKCRYLIRDQDTKFTAGSDMIIRAAGTEPLPLPPRSLNLNAFAERFVKSIKTECVDRMIFFGEASFRHAVTEYVEHHYLHERPHQGKDNLLLFPRNTSDLLPRDGPVICYERLGGLLKFYERRDA